MAGVGLAVDLYQRHVASWFATWAVDLVVRARIVTGSKVLDLGCARALFRVRLDQS